MGSGIVLATLAMTIAELLTTTPKSYVQEFKVIDQAILYSVVPILVGLFISKITYERRVKNIEKQNPEGSSDNHNKSEA